MKTPTVLSPSSQLDSLQLGGLGGGLLSIVNLRIEAYRWATAQVENAFFNDLFRSLQAQDFVFRAQIQTEFGRNSGLMTPAAAEWQTMLANVSLPPSQMSLEVFFEFIVHLHELETEATTALLKETNQNTEWAETLRTRQTAGKLLAGSLAFLEQFDEVFG